MTPVKPEFLKFGGPAAAPGGGGPALSLSAAQSVSRSGAPSGGQGLLVQPLRPELPLGVTWARAVTAARLVSAGPL